MNSASPTTSIASSVLHKLDVPVAYFDPQLVCQYCNPAYARYWQSPTEKLLQKPLYTTWKAHLAVLTPYLADVLRGTDGRIHLTPPEPDALSTLVQLIAHAPEGRVEGFHLVVYPEADTPSQVQHLKQELEALAYSISHDFRAPLRHIEGFSRLLQGKVESHEALAQDADTLKYLDYIRKGATELSTMIDALLQYSRLGRRNLHCTPLDMTAIAQQAVTDAQALHRSRHIDWEVEVLPPAYGDTDMIEYLLELLIDNAVKFTPADALARIHIGSTIHTEGKPPTYFVRDNGVGFDPAFRDNLFGVFQRLHRHDEYPGIGIGLAHASRIIHRHHGRIWADAALDQGATFFFELP